MCLCSECVLTNPTHDCIMCVTHAQVNTYAACCGFDLCHKYILYLYLYLYLYAIFVCSTVCNAVCMATCTPLEITEMYTPQE
jgi:hypothetical protein